MENSKEQMVYILAKHKAEKLRRFYMHGIIYLVINSLLLIFKIVRNLQNGETFNEAFFDFSTFSTAIIWGLVLAIHAFSVYGPDVILGRDWEERKLKQFMQEEEEEIRNQ